MHKITDPSDLAVIENMMRKFYAFSKEIQDVFFQLTGGVVLDSVESGTEDLPEAPPKSVMIPSDQRYKDLYLQWLMKDAAPSGFELDFQAFERTEKASNYYVNKGDYRICYQYANSRFRCSRQGLPVPEPATKDNSRDPNIVRYYLLKNNMTGVLRKRTTQGMTKEEKAKQRVPKIIYNDTTCLASLADRLELVEKAVRDLCLFRVIVTVDGKEHRQDYVGKKSLDPDKTMASVLQEYRKHPSRTSACRDTSKGHVHTELDGDIMTIRLCNDTLLETDKEPLSEAWLKTFGQYLADAYTWIPVHDGKACTARTMFEHLAGVLGCRRDYTFVHPDTKPPADYVPSFGIEPWQGLPLLTPNLRGPKKKA